jgi:hypothetical protein
MCETFKTMPRSWELILSCCIETEQTRLKKWNPEVNAGKVPETGFV